MAQMLIVFLVLGLVGIILVIFGTVKLYVELKKLPQGTTSHIDPLKKAKNTTQDQVQSILRDFEEKWRDQNK